MITELFSHINQNIADQNMRQDSHQIFYCTRNPHLFFLYNISWISHSNNSSHYYHRQTFCRREEKENSRRTGAKIFFKLKPFETIFLYSNETIGLFIKYSDRYFTFMWHTRTYLVWYMYNWDMIFIKCVKEVSYIFAALSWYLRSLQKMIAIKYALFMMYAM